jgi:hypothetical protein
MEKLDRLGWAAGLSFVSHGVRIGIRVNDAEALERVAVHLPPESKPSGSSVVDELCSLLVGGSTRAPGVRRYNLLYWGIGRVARTLDSDEVFQALESLLHMVVSTRAPRKLFVRAAVVGWRGRALVICGPPSSGKTTLAEALVRAGATYYSDQYAVFDARGRVHAYPSPPPSLRNGDGGQARKCPVEMLVGRIGTKPLPVGLVVVTQYRPGTRWRPRVSTSGQALLALLAETVQVRRRPKVALAICRRIAASATTLRGKRGEAGDIALPLLNQLYSGDHDGRLVITSDA